MSGKERKLLGRHGNVTLLFCAEGAGPRRGMVQTEESETRMGNENVTPPMRVYKYYSPSGIEKTLLNNTLRWAVPCEENDPFEALARCWDKEAVKENAQGLRPEDWVFLEGIFNAEQCQKAISHVAAFVSFSKSDKSILMWAHYAANHTGVCLEFDTHKLQGFDCLEEVVYADPADEREEYPLVRGGTKEEDRCNQDRVRKFLSKKASEWTYEHEYRLIVPPMVKYIGCQKVGERFMLISGIPRGAITKLIFGYNVPVSTRLAWAKRVRMTHPDCKFGVIVPDRRKYELVVEDLLMEAIEHPSCQSPASL